MALQYDKVLDHMDGLVFSGIFKIMLVNMDQPNLWFNRHLDTTETKNHEL